MTLHIVDVRLTCLIDITYLHVAATVQDLFQMVSVTDLLTITLQLPKSTCLEWCVKLLPDRRRIARLYAISLSSEFEQFSKSHRVHDMKYLAFSHPVN